ncbi:MAG: RluA family pseudouridine synthase [Patescibacteria group bacterium]
MRIPVIYQDENILVVNKPVGEDVYAVEAQLAKKDKNIKLAHRLDRDTSGLLLLAKNEKMSEWLKAQFKERKIKKVYRAIVAGNLKAEAGRPTGTITAAIGRHPSDARRRIAGGHAVGEKREAVTHYQILQNFPARGGSGKGYTYLEARPVTGRTHQLRVHFKYLGFPIASDRLYAPHTKSLPGLERQALHAYQLTVPMPDKTERFFEAPIPADFAKALADLKT